MTSKLNLNPQEILDEVKSLMAVDQDGMFTLLGNRIVITSQFVFGDIMRASAEIGGINTAKIFLRNAAYSNAIIVANRIKDILKLDGNDLVTYYVQTAGKRGYGITTAEKVSKDEGIIRVNIRFSPFVTGFPKGSPVPVCDFLSGAIEAMCHVAGFAKNIRVIETKCAAKGDDVCYFQERVM